MQGFQFVVDDSGGFSAVAAEFLENIVDEYPNTPVMLYAVQGSGSDASLQSRKRTILGELHDAISFSRLSSYCKLIVPVGLPSLNKSNNLCLLSLVYLTVHIHSLIISTAATTDGCWYCTNLNAQMPLMTLNCFLLYSNIIDTTASLISNVLCWLADA